ncbi:DUF4225 domain-containing protein [Enterobacteriaceae bacterium G50]|nr:DUF4225 domain-containing protein [Enterobacteriaceae bacterium G50]
MSSYGLMSLKNTKADIDRLVFDIAFHYLNDIKIRSDFMVSESMISDDYIDGYVSGRTSFAQAMDGLNKQYHRLLENQSQLQMGSIKLYAIAEREKDRHSTLTITLKRVGFVSGAMQVIGGTGICKVSLGAACKAYGFPLMIQGTENIWENGYYLIYHTDPEKVPVREAYRYAARLLGGDNKGGDIAFSAGDIVLSAGSLSSFALKEDSWKLFHFIQEDYIRNWSQLGAAGWLNEIVGNAASVFSIKKSIGENETNWKELGRE